MDSLLHLAEVAASMDPHAAAASAAPCTNWAEQQLLHQRATGIAAFKQQQLQQQAAILTSANARASMQGSNSAGAGLLQQLQWLKDVLGQADAAQQPQLHGSRMSAPRADAAMDSGSIRMPWQCEPLLLPHPGAYADPAFIAAGGLHDNLSDFMPIPSAGISSSANGFQHWTAQQVKASEALAASTSEDHSSWPGDGKQRWTDEEHSQLETLVAHFGHKNWGAVASYLPGRTGKQCRERYMNHAAKLNKGRWGLQEEFKMAYLHSQYGNKWAHIARAMPGRSDNCLKNHWNAVQRSKRPGQEKGSSFFWTYVQGVQQGMAPADALSAALATLSGDERASLAHNLAAATVQGADVLPQEPSAGGSGDVGSADAPHPAELVPAEVHPAALPVQQRVQHPRPNVPVQAQSAAEALAAATAMVVAAAAARGKGGVISQTAAEALTAAAAAVARAVAAPAAARTNSTKKLSTDTVEPAVAAGHCAPVATNILPPTAFAQASSGSPLPELPAGLETRTHQRQQKQTQQQGQEQEQEQDRLAAEHQARMQQYKSREQQALVKLAEQAAEAVAVHQAHAAHQQALSQQAAAVPSSQHAYDTQKQQQALPKKAAAAAKYAEDPGHQLQRVKQAWQEEQQQVQQAVSQLNAAATQQPSQRKESQCKQQEPQQQAIYQPSNETIQDAAAAIAAANAAAAPAPAASASVAFKQALNAAAAATAAGNAQVAAAAVTNATSLASHTVGSFAAHAAGGFVKEASTQLRNGRTSAAAAAAVAKSSLAQRQRQAHGPGQGEKPSSRRSSAQAAQAAAAAAAVDLLAPRSALTALPRSGKTGLSGLVRDMVASCQPAQHHHDHHHHDHLQLQLQGARRADVARLEAALQQYTTGGSAKVIGSTLLQPHHGQERHDAGVGDDKLQKRQERMCTLVAGALSSMPAVPDVDKQQLASRRGRQRALEQFLSLQVPSLQGDNTAEQQAPMQLQQYEQIPAQSPQRVQHQQQVLQPMLTQPRASAIRAAKAAAATLAAAAPQLEAAAAATGAAATAAAAPGSEQPPDAAVASGGTPTPVAAAAATAANASAPLAAETPACNAAAPVSKATATAQPVELMKLTSTEEGKKLLESLKALGLLRTDLPPEAQLAIQLVVSTPRAAAAHSSAADAASTQLPATTAAAAAATAVDAASDDTPAAPGSPDSHCSSKSSDPAKAVKLEPQQQPAAELQHCCDQKQAVAAAAGADAAVTAPAVAAPAVAAPAVAAPAMTAPAMTAPAVTAQAMTAQAGDTDATANPAAVNQPSRKAVECNVAPCAIAQDMQHCADMVVQGSNEQLQASEAGAAKQLESSAYTVGSKRPISAVLGGTALSAAISAAKRVLHNPPAWREVTL